MNTLIKTKKIMNKFNIIANKRYGQNFLIDDNILENIDKIIEDIEASECVLDLVVDKDKNNIDLNMIFYWENLLTEVDKKVDATAKILGVEMDLKDIKEMSADILDDDEFNDDLINRIKYFGNDHEQELN